jgi:hypothetical protein
MKKNKEFLMLLGLGGVALLLAVAALRGGRA